MIRKIVDEIPLIYTFRDVRHGIVYPVFSKSGYVPGSQDGREYLDAIPDSNRKSIVYWEDHGSNVVSSDARRWRVSHNLRLIAWMNFDKIDQEYDKCVGQLLYSVPKKIENTIISYKGQVPKDMGIFSRYNYKEGKQFMTYPYDVVCFKFNVLYFIPCSQDFL